MGTLLCAVGASAGKVFDVQFNDVAGTVVDAVAVDPTPGFNPSGVDAFGATDGAGHMVWTNMTSAATGYAGLDLTEGPFDTNSTETLVYTVRITDFDFGPETTYGANLVFELRDASKLAKMVLQVGGPGTQLQVRSQGYNQSVVNHGGIFTDASNLTMTQAGWATLDLQWTLNLSNNTHGIAWQHDDAGYTTLTNGMALGLGAGDGLFAEIDKIRIGAGSAFLAGSMIEIDSVTVETYEPPPVPVVTNLINDVNFNADGSATETPTNSTLDNVWQGTGTGTFSLAPETETFGVTDGSSMNWSNMVAGNKSAFAGLGDTFVAGTNLILRSTVRIADFNFDEETTFGAAVGFGLGDASKLAYLQLRVGGSGNQLQIKADTLSEDLQAVIKISPDTNLNMTAFGWTGLQLRMDVDLETDTYNLFYLREGVDADWQTGATGGAYGLSDTNVVAFEELDKIRIGTASTPFQSGSTVSIDQWTIETIQEVQVPPTNSTPESYYSDWVGGFSVGAESNLTDDADGDLLDNLTEYAFGGNPGNPNENGNMPVQSQMSEGGANYLVHVYYERADAADRGLASMLELGTDLVVTNWGTAGIEFVGSGASAIPGYNAVTNRISTDDAAKKFLNLRIKFTP